MRKKADSKPAKPVPAKSAKAKPAAIPALAGPVAFLGPAATFTHQAALQQFGPKAKLMPCASIAEVFDAVSRGQAGCGVVPVENSTEGAVSYTLDMFADSPVRICAEIFLPIHHHLLCRCALSEIRVIYSHPHVFGQCRNWLRRYLPDVTHCDVASTTEAARRAAAEENAAAIAADLASEIYGIPVRERSIEDNPGNMTRFFVIGSSSARPTGNDKTSLLLGIRDRVGALLDSLEPFRRQKISLSFIESRPSRRRNWEYQFYIDIVGHTEDANVRTALGELTELCEFVKCLGSYPRAQLPQNGK